jgi:hypothetical protein
MVAKQVHKEFGCNNEKMVEYLVEVCKMEKFFDGFEVWYVARLKNRHDDHLVWIATSRAPTPLDVIVEKLSKPSIKAVESSKTVVRHDLMVIHELEQEPVYDWMHLINIFLETSLHRTKH